MQTNSRNVVVRGNDIHHNSGDGVQCLGPEEGATEPGTPFDNLLVEDNDLHENRENGADIKTCTRVTLRGRSATRWDARSVEKEPGFMDSEAGDFRLGPSSPARNAGLPLGQAFCGSAPDMGARESDCP